MTYFALALRSQGTPGLWWHTCRPIQFLLIVDDFGVEYIGKQHAEHLENVLKKYHEISQDWEGKKFLAYICSGIIPQITVIELVAYQ